LISYSITKVCQLICLKRSFSLCFQIIPINNGGGGQGKPLIIETTNLNKPASLSHVSPRTGSADKTGSSRMETGSASSSLSPTKIGIASGSSSKLPLDGAAVTGSTRFSKTGKRIGRPPKKGTQMAISSLGTGTVIGNMAVTASAASSGSSSEAAVSIKRQVSPPSSPEPDDFDAKRRKTSPNKR
jgi:hypothetical protein